MTFSEYFGKWANVLDFRELSFIMEELKNLYRCRCVSPSLKDIFKAFELCPYDSLKVVMIGQDPYPQKGVATGILFGNKKGTEEALLSPSLAVIKESVINFEIPHEGIRFDNTLESWSKQGVLLINSALTVEVNRVGSHSLLWRNFIAYMLKELSNKEPGIIYILFGNQAKSLRTYINEKSNIILEENHPAYYARTKSRMPRTVFDKLDVLLKERYGESITWFEEF